MTVTPRFALGMAPIATATIPNLFGDSAARKLLEHPGRLRMHGWDLETEDTARIVKGHYLEVGNGDWKRIRLFEHGALVASVPANDQFLGRLGTRGDFWIDPRLNPLALAELVYSFVRLYSGIIPHISPRPVALLFSADARHFVRDDARIYVVPAPLNSIAFDRGLPKYSSPESKAHLEFVTEGISVTEREADVAARMLERVYAWFGVRHEEVPYTALDANGVRVLDVALLRSGGRPTGPP